MHGATSTGNVENRTTPAGWASADAATQGQTQSGRSVQQQTSVQPALQPLCSAVATISMTTTATPGTSRRITGSDETESVRLQQGQSAQKPDLPELRYSAARYFFKQIEEVVNARKPGASEAGKPHNPEAIDEDTSGLSCAFDRAISEAFEESGIQQDVLGEKNTLPLCRVVARKTTAAVSGLIEKLRNARESASSEPGIQCQPELIEKLAGAIHEFLERLEKNEEIWVQHNALPLCQAIVKGILALARDYCDANAHGFIEAVTGPVYGLALNGALAELKQQQSVSHHNDWQIVLLLADLTQHLGFHSRKDDLLLSNAVMLEGFFSRLCPYRDETLPFHPNPGLDVLLPQAINAVRGLRQDLMGLKCGTANLLLCKSGINAATESLAKYARLMLYCKNSFECDMCTKTRQTNPRSNRCEGAAPL